MKRPVPARVIVSVFSAAIPEHSKKLVSAALTLLFAALISLLALSPTPTCAAPPTFSIGQHVGTRAVTNVRAAADGAKIGTQPKNATGSIAAGPLTVPGNSVTWYRVNFATAPSGWVGADMLVAGGAGATAPQSVVVGNGTAQTMVLDEFGNIEIGFISNDATSSPTYSFSESTNQGLSFSTPTILPMAPKVQVPNAPTGPVIASERNGAIDVVYACLPTDCPPGHFNLQAVEMIRSTDHGASWSGPIQISLPTRPSGFGAQEPVVASCGEGVTIAWQDDGIGANYSQTNPDIILVNVVNGAPGTPINLSNSGASEGHPQISVNPQSNVYVSWVTDNQNTSTAQPFNSIVFASVPNCGAVKK